MFYGQEPTVEEAIVIALCDAIGALPKNFDKAQLKQHKARIQSIAKGEGIVSDAVGSVIDDMQAVIIAAVMVPVVTASL